MGLQLESLKRLYCKHSIATEFADGEVYKFVQEDGMLMINDIFKGNAEDLNFLIELGKELKTQDTLGTRKPVIFTIQDVRRSICDEGEEDFNKVEIFDTEGEPYTFNDDEVMEATEFLERVYDFDESEELDNVLDFNDLIEFCEDRDIQHVVYPYKHENYYTGEFLTRKAAKKYLEEYNHRFNHPTIHIMYSGENKELLRLTEILERLYEMNCKEEPDAQ